LENQRNERLRKKFTKLKERRMRRIGGGEKREDGERLLGG
jgi:hypothetical protein